jgi:hypothetical protein
LIIPVGDTIGGVLYSRVLAVALLGAMTAIAGSCGSNGSSGGASSCQTACNRCGSDLCVDCAATSARLRNEFENAVYACVLQGNDASCDTVWTNCIVQAEGQLTPRPADTTYRDACLAKKSDCDASGAGFADDNCLLSPILEEALVAQAQQCLSETCANIGACFRPLFN